MKPVPVLKAVEVDQVVEDNKDVAAEDVAAEDAVAEDVAAEDVVEKDAAAEGGAFNKPCQDVKAMMIFSSKCIIPNNGFTM
jgi:hypothetical protein